MAVAAQVAPPLPIENDADALRLAIGAGCIGLFEYNPAEDALRVSTRLVELFGIDDPAGCLHSRDVIDRIHPDDLARVRELYRAPEPAGRPRQVELRLRSASGEYRWMQVCTQARGQGTSRRWHGTCEDVNERHSALEQHREQESRLRVAIAKHAAIEAQLRDSEAQLRLALDAASMHTWRADLDADRFEPSPGLRSLHGFPAGDAPLEAADVLARVHPEDRPRVAQHHAARDFDGTRIEYRTVSPDGSVRWIAVASRLRKDAAGRATAQVIGTACDITEQKATESALTAVYETSPLLIGVVELLEDGDLRHVYDNPAVCRFFGLDAGVTAGKRASELGVDTATIALWRRHYDQAVTTNRAVAFEYAHRQADGAERTLSVTVAPLRQYGPSGRPVVCYVAEDVTQRREAAVAAASSEERLRLALQAASAGAWEWDLRAGSILWSAEMFELYGFPQSTGPLRFEDFELGVDPRDRAAVRDAIDLAMRVESPFFSCDFRVRQPGGQLRWLRALGKVERSPDGTPRRMYGLNLDVTAQKRMEEALQRADRQKDQFLAMLSHELRNPLAPIRTVAKILGSPHVDGEQVAWARQVIQRQVNHLALLLDDLLDVARITQGKLVLKRETIPLQSVVEPAIEAVQPLLDEKQHTLDVRLPTQDIRLDVDGLRLAQVVSNLLTNAAKYTPAGGRIALRIETADDRLAIEVSDNGVGIPPNALPHIFAMFSQVDGGGSLSGGGLGIGLALAKGLVELHGGRIEARSGGTGAGSTFRVTLPGAVAASGNAPAADPAADPAAAPIVRRVLVIDDNADAADALAMLLGLAGHDVRVAHGGLDGVRVAGEFHPEVCIVDIGMPDLDGYGVARALRAEPWCGSSCLVALTGWGQATDKTRAAQAGFDRHLTKPVDPDEVEKLIAGVGTKRPARDEPGR